MSMQMAGILFPKASFPEKKSIPAHALGENASVGFVIRLKLTHLIH